MTYIPLQRENTDKSGLQKKKKKKFFPYMFRKYNLNYMSK